MGTVAALVIVASSATAQQRIEEIRPASPSGVVEVANVAGSVTVVGWAREEVQVVGVLGQGTERLDFESGPQRTTVRVVLPRNCRACEGSDLTIRVPTASAVEVAAVSADISVHDITGRCVLKSVSGKIQVRGNPSWVEARSVSGDVRLRGVRTPVRAKSVSGAVIIEGAAGSVEASSVSGRIQVRGHGVARVELAATSGSILLEGSLAPGARVEAKSVSGDMTLVLPHDTVGDFEITTFSGSIRNEFGPQAQRVSQYFSERELSFSTGSGGARIVLQSFSGSITLEKK